MQLKLYATMKKEKKKKKEHSSKDANSVMARQKTQVKALGTLALHFDMFRDRKEFFFYTTQ